MGKRPATYADREALPSNQIGEILGGVLYAFPRPALPHTRAASRFGGELGGPFDRASSGPGGWIILDAPELHFGDDVLVPDLAGWRRERMPELPDDAFITLAPDWVCEVLSGPAETTMRSTRRVARHEQRSANSARMRAFTGVTM
jgi:Uma2 family endonuclease